MKKLLLLTAAFASMLFASCSKEEMTPQANETTVTYTVEIPSVQTKGDTKAIGDGFNVDQLVYEVWKTEVAGIIDQTSSESVRLFRKEALMTKVEGQQRTTITLNLVQDQNYTILFWAQKEGTGYYNTENLTNVHYNPIDYVANNEHLAAFYGVEGISIENATVPNRTVFLKRPFAQLNLGTINSVLNDEYTITMKTSKVTFDNVPTSFNVATKTAGDYDAFEFVLGNVYDSENPDAFPQFITVNDENYYYASMNYIFAAKEGHNTDITYEINTELNSLFGANATPATITNTVTNVPLQENYRTNIIGNLLTSLTDFTVVIDNTWENPEYVQGENWSQTGSYVYTIHAGAPESTLLDVLNHADAQARESLTKSSEGISLTINLNCDVEWETGAGIGSTPLLSDDSPITSVTINGNGKTFTATGKGVGSIRLANGGTLTFNNVKVVDLSVSYAENSWEYGYLEFAGNLEFNECEFVNAIMMESEEAEFTNCSFNSFDDNQYAVWVSDGTVSFDDCTFAGARGLKVHEAYGSEVVSVLVDGCTFDKLTKKPGIALGDLNAETSISINNSTFDRCQAGDQNNYMYETDTDVTTFNFVESNNIVIPSGDAFLEQEDGSIVVSSAEGLKAAINAVAQNTTIKLANGTYEGLFYVNGKGLNIEALNAGEATINGKLGIAASGKTVNVKGIVFENSYSGSVAAGHQYLDKTGTYCIGLYCASVNVENCTFNLSKDGGINFYAVNYPERCSVKNCTFNANGFRPIISKANLTVEGCTFNDQNKYALQVWGNQNTGNETVVFTNNTINNAGETSGVAAGLLSYVSVSGSYPISNVAFTIQNNTPGYNFIYDLKDNVKITECTLNGNTIAAGQCISIPGVTDVKSVVMDYEQGATYVGTSADLTAALSANKSNIVLLGGVEYEGTFKPNVATAFKSSSSTNKATIKGRVNVGGIDCSFEDIKFGINDASKHKNTFSGAPYQYPGIVVGYGAALSFEGCEFETSLAKAVCGINSGNHADNSDLLTVNNCKFTGDFYAIRTRTLFNITNNVFDIYTNQGTLAAVWTWGNGNSGANNVTFTGNTNINTNKVYGVQMTSSNFVYDYVNINVQNNVNFHALADGVVPARFNGTHTFAEGSETF